MVKQQHKVKQNKIKIQLLSYTARLAFVLGSLIYAVQHKKLPRHGTSSTQECIAELLCYAPAGVRCDSAPLATEGVRSTVS